MEYGIRQENERRTLELFRSFLRSKIGPQYCDGIAWSLKSDGAISQEISDDVLNADDNRKFDILYGDLLNRNVPGSFQSFVNSLPEGLSEVKDFIEGNNRPTDQKNATIKWSMEVFHRKIVTKINAIDILLDFPDILDKETRDLVLSKRTHNERSFHFIHNVLKSPRALTAFIEALESGEFEEHRSIIGLLKGAEPTMSCKKTTSEDDDQVRRDCESPCSSVCWSSIQLFEEVEPLDILDHLDISETDKNTIMEKKFRCERVECLVNALAFTPGWLEKLISSLQQCNGTDKKYMKSIGTLQNTQEIIEEAETTEEDPENPNYEANLNNLNGRNELESSSKSSSDSKKSDEAAKMKEFKFQKELAKPAIHGSNCVIVSQTGTGKTFIAVRICREHLLRNKHAKVVFLVHKVPLVLQQYKVFKKNLGIDGVKLEQLSGQNEINSPTATLIKDNQVIVMTHDILKNNLRSNKIKFDEISLLFFDECHNTTKKHPYQMIMDIYFDEKQKGMKLPQVVGLTATPGSGKACDTRQACKHIQTLFACLDVTIPPVTVVENVEELQCFISEGAFETIPVRRSAMSKFSEVLKQLMKEVERKMQDRLEENENCVNGLTFGVCQNQGTQEYEGNIVNLDKKITLKVTENRNLRLELKAYVQHLRMFNDALFVDEQLRPFDANNFIEYEWEKDFSENSTLRAIKELYENSEIERCADTTPSPLLKQLVELLRNHFTSKPDSRCIVFVRTRAVAKLLSECLNDDPQLAGFQFNATYLTGSGAASREGGLTKNKQDERLAVFREGESKVIAATSIADEGIDIERCNLVVTYNHGTNEVTEVQRKGRGRAKDSEMLVLCYEDSKFIANQKTNKARQILVQQSLEIFKNMDKKDFEREIREIQRELQRLKQGETTKVYDKDTWKLYCKNCQTFVTTTANLWKIKNSHHVVVDEDFDDKCTVVDAKYKCIDDMEFIGIVLCKDPECRLQWGRYIVYKKTKRHIITIKSLLCEKEGKRELYKTWSLAPFKIERSFDDYLQTLNNDD